MIRSVYSLPASWPVCPTETVGLQALFEHLFGCHTITLNFHNQAKESQNGGLLLSLASSYSEGDAGWTVHFYLLPLDGHALMAISDLALKYRLEFKPCQCCLESDVTLAHSPSRSFDRCVRGAYAYYNTTPWPPSSGKRNAYRLVIPEEKIRIMFNEYKVRIGCQYEIASPQEARNNRTWYIEALMQTGTYHV